MKEDAKPHAVHSAKRVPFPQRENIAEELKSMESLGVISKVDSPSEWCAPMVVVSKKELGKVRICVDLKALNESVLHEIYPLPKVDETLAKLASATSFSKLDANSGFWQIYLSEDT